MAYSNEWQDQASQAVDVILSGGTIIYPTETIWGIGCDATNDEAIRRIFRIKKRDSSKKMITLIAEAKDIFNFVTSPPPEILDIIDSFERPTSMIFDGVIGISELLISDGTAAFRVAGTAFTKALIKQSSRPMVTTSANFSAEPTPKNFGEISPDLLHEVNYTVSPIVIDYDMTGQPSDIVKIDADGRITQIR